MWLTWALVAFAVAMVVGPVMLIRPSPGMNRLAKIRSIANKKGMIVRLQASNKSNLGATYYIPLSKSLRRQVLDRQWFLEMKNYTHEAHFEGQWDWHDDGRIAACQEHIIRALLAALPEGVSQLQFNSLGLGCFWNEACRGRSEEDAVESVHAFLRHALQKMETAA